MSRKRLKSSEDLRRYLASLINRTESGKIKPELSGKLGYLCSILLRAIENGELEERLTEIETRLQRGNFAK